MRLTVNLDPQNYVLAKSLAKADDCTISAAVNRLLRKSVEPRSGAARPVTKSGFRVSRGAMPITPDMVRQIDEEQS